MVDGTRSMVDTNWNRPSLVRPHRSYLAFYSKVVATYHLRTAYSLLLTSCSTILLLLTGDDLSKHNDTVAVHEGDTRKARPRRRPPARPRRRPLPRPRRPPPPRRPRRPRPALAVTPLPAPPLPTRTRSPAARPRSRSRPCSSPRSWPSSPCASNSSSRMIIHDRFD